MLFVAHQAPMKKQAKQAYMKELTTKNQMPMQT